MKEKVFKIVERWMDEHDYPCGETVHQSDECIIDSVVLASSLADVFDDHNNARLLKIALNHHEKGYNYSSLRDSDSLYNETERNREICLDYFEDINEKGRAFMYDVLRNLKQLNYGKRN